MSTLIQRVTILVFSSMASPASLAQITLDGTLGRSGALPGPDYQITANLGQQVGANLYHSFGQFNLQSGESATFSGPESVNQVIGRVTGGFASQINGTLRSTTNVYLLNPAGIVFGEGARLDVQGSFHASTADTLRFEDGSEFNARQPNKSLLTLAPIRAFGFVSDTIAPITVAAGRGQIGETDWDGKPTGLSVPEGKTLSLIGGNIEIKNGTFYDTVKNQNEQSWTEATRLGSLNAPGGRLNLASVNSAGEVISTDAGLEVSAPRLGDVTLAEKSLINVSGRGAGNIFIRAGHLLLRDSDIWANTLGDLDGGRIDIQVGSLFASKDWWISGSTQGAGKGANIKIAVTESAIFSGEEDGDIEGIASAQSCQAENRRGRSRIVSLSCCDGNTADLLPGGDAGDIWITGKSLTFRDGAYISGNTYGQGNTGNVTLSASEEVNFLGENKVSGLPSSIYLRTKSNKNQGTGDSGKVRIEARDILFKDGAQITTSTYGRGKSGSITLHAAESVHFAGENSRGWNTEIFLTSFGKQLEEAGQAGSLDITAKNILFEGGAAISGTTFSSGPGGNITLKADESVIFSGESTGSVGRKYRSSILLETHYSEDGAGNAGNLRIEARNIAFKNGGMLFGSTWGTGKAGKIMLCAKDTLSFTGEAEGELTEGESLVPDFYASGVIATALKKSTGGNGGDIEIEANQVLLADGATLTTETGATGKAGKITLNTSGRLTITGTNSRNGKNSSIRSSSSDIGDAGEIAMSSDIGDAGEIAISANTINLIDGGEISTSATSADGGNISIKTPNLLYLRGSAIKTDVARDQGNGGNITIDKPQFTVLDKSQINANAYGGNGGNIYITAAQYIRSSDSLVTASSQLGINGNIQIEAPETNIEEEMIALPKSFEKPSLYDGCQTQLTGKQESSFTKRVNWVEKPREEVSGGVLGSYLDLTAWK